MPRPDFLCSVLCPIHYDNRLSDDDRSVCFTYICLCYLYSWVSSFKCKGLVYSLQLLYFLVISRILSIFCFCLGCYDPNIKIIAGEQPFGTIHAPI